jgi:Berberine and berberine like
MNNVATLDPVEELRSHVRGAVVNETGAGPGEVREVFKTIAWVRSAWQAVAQFGTGGVYLNFTGLAGETPSAGVDSAYERNLERLAQVKAAYDPDNFFHVNHNIRPT